MPMTVIAKKRCRAMFEPPKKDEPLYCLTSRRSYARRWLPLTVCRRADALNLRFDFNLPLSKPRFRLSL
jgi:hypothetical protein